MLSSGLLGGVQLDFEAAGFDVDNFRSRAHLEREINAGVARRFYGNAGLVFGCESRGFYRHVIGTEIYGIKTINASRIGGGLAGDVGAMLRNGYAGAGHQSALAIEN